MAELHDFEVLLPSAARTATPTALRRKNQCHRGVLLTIHVTARTGASTLTPEIRVPNSAGVMTAHGYWAAAAAIAATGAFEYLLYPGVPTTAGNLTEIDGMPLPADFDINIAHGTADSITYDVVAHFLV